ncbi:hypothetical protein KOW79_009475 [Hemibagrus wyckioides]|uniref:Uncharacterized protein n=1 Tax=Hemibagrus wyckioides TaxID=337641 RepID=A0A9D3NT99_9TELE|nr:hypothetical protein KOW79_009475 [Hemibagrus wyckioides]
MKSVFGDEQNITHESPASTYSQLMCHSSETAGPPSGNNLASLLPIDKQLDAALQDADRYYRLKKYAAAASCFTAALQGCSKGAVLGKPFSADYEDISKVVGFIESRLVACYLRLQKPDLAMVYRLLGNPCGAARSAMIADYVHWLSGDGEQTISKLIKLYWQGLLEKAIRRKKDFSALREQEHAQVLEHTLAELALASYLQEISPSDTSLLQALMADTMDTLEGKRTDQGRVWNAVQKVGLIEDLIYQWEKSYLKNQVQQPVRKLWKKGSEALKQNAVSMLNVVTSTLPAKPGVPRKQPAADIRSSEQ